MTCTLPYDCMRATAESTMLDACQLGVVATGGWGQPDTGNHAPAWGSEIACGFQPANRGEVKDGSQAPNYDARLRLPLTVDANRIDRVRMTKRHGEAINEEDYSIEGQPERGPSAQVLTLKRITGNSTR